MYSKAGIIHKVTFKVFTVVASHQWNFNPLILKPEWSMMTCTQVHY